MVDSGPLWTGAAERGCKSGPHLMICRAEGNGEKLIPFVRAFQYSENLKEASTT